MHPISFGNGGRLIQLARWCAIISGAISILGITFLIGFYATYLTIGDRFGLGALNDAAVVAQYVLMIPIAVVLFQVLRPNGPILSLIGLALGIAGMSAVIVLQILLLLSLIPFQQTNLASNSSALNPSDWIHSSQKS